VKSVVDAVSIPVTVKIRSGWDNENINCVEVAKLIEKAGASAISIHPRTRSQGYSGKADWNLIKSIKECVSIPVIGNGDIKSCYDAKRMLDETKCDAIMIGRACIGNPWIFRETDEYLKDGKTPKAINNLEVFEILNKHIDLLQKTIGDKLAVLEIRPHIANYLKHFRNSSELINKIFRTKNIIEVKNLLIEYRNNSNV
jgi:nifR3 family TIM-barrel protein